MRVISGTAKGRSLVSPKGLETRPTADRIKESVFNIIGFDLEGATFLDLFAGSGAIGIEALSRGARKCFFAENDREAYTALVKNLESTRLLTRAEVYFSNAELIIRELADKAVRFDFVFMDPPYGQASQMERLTELVGRTGILADDGVIIGEHSADFDISLWNIEPIRRKSYGKTTAVSFWRPAAEYGEC